MSSELSRILFVCVKNSFRSQIAEAIMNHKYGDHFIAESAGLNTSEIHPLAIKVMGEYGIDISNNTVNSVFDYYKEGRLYSHVVTVCSREDEKECPIFPGVKLRINWELENPEYYTGSEEEKYKKAKNLVSDIERRIDELVKYVQSQYSDDNQ